MDNLIIPMENVGKVSDGYHTFDELYEHRHLLFINLLKMMKELGYETFYSYYHSDGSCYTGWFIAGVTINGKQITYHIPERLAYLCEDLPVLDKAPKFDGHTSDDVLERLRQLALEKKL